ncbi:hypothetical protein ABFG93_03040 [Pseudalkalibacillus hwajinpoensis]|uniref:hypothetical protein n=1 Tax=Guptibacillus hwajinpoensis TaxID=208199 RepID=UPI00325A8506
MIGIALGQLDISLSELLFEWTLEDEEWLLSEFGRQPSLAEVISYIQTYEGIGCEWKVWFEEEEAIAITCVLNQAPSNLQAWLGTIVVRPDKRNSGRGSSVIKSETKRYRPVIFAGIPYNRNEWSMFLGKCGFDQYGIEESPEETFLIFVKPSEE